MVAGASWMEAEAVSRTSALFDNASLILRWAPGILFPILSLPYQFARHDWQLCLVIYLIMVIFLTGFLVIF